MLSARDLLAGARDAAGRPAPPTGPGSPDARVSTVQAAALLAVLLLATTSAVVVSVLMALLSVWAFLGPHRALQAVSLAALLKILNPALVQQGLLSGLLAWVVLLAAGVAVLPRMRSGDLRFLAPLLAFALVAALLSSIASADPAVSALKAASFAWTVATVFVAYRALTREQFHCVVAWFTTLGLVTVVASLATLVEPAVAFRVTGTSLQGITLHPQTLAVLTVPLAAYALTATALRRGAARAAGIVAAVVFSGVLLATEARTGVIAAAAGLLAGLLMQAWQNGRDVRFAARGRVVAVVALVATGVGMAAVAGGALFDRAEAFLLKRSGESSLAEAFEQSRGAGVVGQWRNFRERPLSGHGFGVYAANGPPNESVRYLGLPISAPVEKGFLPTAVLEETGLPGALLLAIALFGLGRHVWRGGDPRWFAVFVACLATNAGEATLLAPGGPGLLLWCAIGLAVRAAADGASDRRGA